MVQPIAAAIPARSSMGDMAIAVMMPKITSAAAAPLRTLAQLIVSGIVTGGGPGWGALALPPPFGGPFLSMSAGSATSRPGRR